VNQCRGSAWQIARGGCATAAGSLQQAAESPGWVGTRQAYQACMSGGRSVQVQGANDKSKPVFFVERQGRLGPTYCRYGGMVQSDNVARLWYL
jgi:hypothetical protein